MFEDSKMKEYYMFDNMKRDIEKKLMKLPNMEQIIFSGSPDYI